MANTSSTTEITSMSHDQPSEAGDEMDDGIEDTQSSSELRLFIGLPVLAVFLFLADWIVWAIAGKPPELAPILWLNRVGTTCALIFLGLILLGSTVAVLWGLGLVAMTLGGILIKSCRRQLNR
ncbi:hypothetical protein ABQJ54_18780 [Rhodanobacter sp. Si-c]|uniref:Uncharacterized protein n=1 Tax=Rhodanobacter lycopersici TaxID=3162487 RepID=A0ABV3QJD4_9GAMM